MKLKKFLKFTGVSFLVVCLLTGCQDSSEKKDTLKEDENKIEAKCEVRDCIKQIEVTNTAEEINEIIGVEAEKSDSSDKYTWKLSDKESITITYSNNSAITQATIDKTKIASDKVDFGVYTDIKKLLNSGQSLTYEEMVEKLGGVEGTLAGKTSTSKRYIWVDKHDQTFAATFSDTLGGKCSIISLR